MPPLRRFVLFGPPGCGKGTYARIFSQRLGIPHLGLGDAIRAAAADDAVDLDLARVLRARSREGRPVPDGIVRDMVARLIEGAGGGGAEAPGG